MRPGIAAIIAGSLCAHLSSIGGPPEPVDSEDRARALQENWSTEARQPVEYVNSVGMRFRLIPAGRFRMGSGDDRAPARDVTITTPFYLGTTEVTRTQWETVTGRQHSSYFPGPDHPINFVTIYDVRRFLAQLNKLEQTTAYRLPTEAEWELAARAGTSTQYPGGDTPEALSAVGWFVDNADAQTHPVATKPANAFGLHDMHGNVWEWCSDHYDPDYYRWGPSTDPAGPDQTLYGYIVLRGGSVYHPAEAARSGNRAFYQGSRSARVIGFRVALTIELEDEE